MVATVADEPSPSLAPSVIYSDDFNFMLLLMPLPFLLVDVLEVAIGEASLVAGMAIRNRIYLFQRKHLIEDTWAGQLEDPGIAAFGNILIDPFGDLLEMGGAGHAGDEVVAQRPLPRRHEKLIVATLQNTGQRPDRMGIDVHVDTTMLEQHQYSPYIGLGGANLQPRVVLVDIIGVVCPDELTSRLGDHEAIFEGRRHQPIAQIVQVDGQCHFVSEISLPYYSRDASHVLLPCPPRAGTLRQRKAFVRKNKMKDVTQYFKYICSEFY